MRVALTFVTLCGVAVCLVGCSGGEQSPGTPGANGTTGTSGTNGTAGTAAESAAPFVDVAEATGLAFRHFIGRSGEFYFCEPVGSGAALFDFDGDGDLDVYIVQGAMLGEGKELSDSLDPVPGDRPPSDRLFRNDLDGGAELAFTDITDEVGLASHGYGMGVATGDYDADGWIDLYVTNFGENVLLRNVEGKRLENVTEAAGVAEDRWSASAAFFDFDHDGHLDLFVCNYVDFTYFNHKPCYSVTSARDYCGPLSYSPLPDRLFRNRGDGTFEDVSGPSQIAREFGGALGVACTDLNGDGWLDVYVANDGLANQMWINQRDGTFENEALLAGCAYNAGGKAEASMGIDVADFDGDGDEDIFLAHLTDETNTLYVNDGQGLFEDGTMVAGLGTASRAYTAFGTVWLDYDGDGWLDLYTANGAIKAVPEQERQGVDYPLRQRNQLYKNLGGGKFRDVSEEAGEMFAVEEVSRGAASGDLDNDGDVDILLINNNGAARLLQNRIGNTNPWIGLDVRDVSGRAPEGTLVEIVVGNDRFWRRVRSVASYLCANDPRVVAGLGSASGSATVRVHWQGGEVEEWSGLALRRYHDVVQGQGH